MQLTITRQESTDNGTKGTLVTNQGFSCDTLELPWRDNEKGKSCIIADSYQGNQWYSPHLQRLVIRLEDKHGRADCLLHNGTFAGDVDKGGVTQVHGCTEIGRGYGDIDRGDGTKQFGILNSRVTLAQLIEHLGDGPHEVTYEWADGCSPA